MAEGFLDQLSSFEKGQSLTSFLKEIPTQPQNTSLFSRVRNSLFSKGMEEEGKLTKEEERLLKHRIITCSDELRGSFCQARPSYQKLLQLQQQLFPLLEKQVFEDFEQAVLQQSQNPEKINAALKRLLSDIIEITSENLPSSFSFPAHYPCTLATFNFNAFAYLGNTPTLVELKQQNARKYVEYLVDKQRVQRLKERLASKEATQRDDLWISFEKILTKEGVLDLAKELSVEQVAYLFDLLRSHSDQQWKLVYIITGIKFSTLEQLLCSCDEEWISLFNTILQKQEPSVLKHLSERIMDMTQEFADRNNEVKFWVDAETKKFRKIRSWSDAKKEHLQDVDNLLVDIGILSSAPVNFAALLKKVIKCPEAFKALELHIPAQYRHFERRLKHDEKIYSDTEVLNEIETHKSQLALLKAKYPDDKQVAVILNSFEARLERDKALECDSMVEGCIFGILYNNLFLENDIELDTEAYLSISVVFGLHEKQDYFNYGLLHPMTKEEFSKLASKEVKSEEVIKIARDKLTKVGIHTTLDWLRLRIINRELLKEYFEKPEVKKLMEIR